MVIGSPSPALLLRACTYWTLEFPPWLHGNDKNTNSLQSLYRPLTKLTIHYPELVQILSGPNSATSAAELLARGALVILPTETVYGLGANAEDARAVHRIFTTKDRPVDHPLIVHISDAECLDFWAVDIPDYARDLAAAFWPGPMTLVLNRSNKARDFITGNQDTVALRVPRHDLTRNIIEQLGILLNNPCAGIAAPSANRFGKVSPTTVHHALAELQGYMNDTDAAVDGGPAHIGIESTIIDCTGDSPIVLRRGAVTERDIAALKALSVMESSDSHVRAPGMLASHYSPHARVQMITSSEEVPLQAPHASFLALENYETPANTTRLAAPCNAQEYARSLYAALRQADDMGSETIYVIPPEGPGIAAAVRDRITRAAYG